MSINKRTHKIHNGPVTINSHIIITSTGQKNQIKMFHFHMKRRHNFPESTCSMIMTYHHKLKHKTRCQDIL